MVTVQSSGVETALMATTPSPGLGGKDVLNAGSDNDIVNGDGSCPPSAPYCIPGNAGSDRILCGSGDATVRGNRGNDRVSGESGDDPVRANTGPTGSPAAAEATPLPAAPARTPWPAAAVTTLRGERGEDKISGASGRDVISGGGGDDTITARDGERDRSSCGSGRDKVTADKRDRVAKNYERVSRNSKK